MADLTTKYLGLQLKNPIIAGASGLTSNMDMIKKIEKTGIGAIVCKSLFEEEIQLESLKLGKDLHEYDNIGNKKRREILARVKAWIDVSCGVNPKYMGETYDITGDGERTWDEIY